MSKYVVDSSVVLALLRAERGADVAVALVDERPLLSAVNLVEVIAKLQDSGMSESMIDVAVEQVEAEIVAFSPEQAMDAGLLRNLTRHVGLSLGDRACFALAREARLPILTADRAWSTLNLGVEVRLIR